MLHVNDKLTICAKGLKAIQARISGVWDEPALEEELAKAQAKEEPNA